MWKIKIANIIQKHSNKSGFIYSILLGLIPVLWFKGEIITGEEWYALDYIRWVELFSHTWSDAYNFGEPSTLVPLRIQGAILWIFFLFVQNYYYVLILWHVFLWELSSVGMYLFLTKLFGDRISVFTKCLGVTYYVLNPYFLNISPLLMPPRIVFAALPYLMLNLLEIFRSENVRYKFVMWICLILFLASPAFVNLPAGAVLPGLIVLALIFRFLLADFNPDFFTRYFLAFLVLFITTSFWWMYPVVKESLIEAGSIKSAAGSFTAISTSGAHDVLSLFGSWAFREKIYGYDYFYFPYFESFDRSLLLLVRYVPFVLILAGMIFSIRNNIFTLSYKKDKHFIIFLYVTFFLFLILSKGTSGLFGGVYELIFKYLPYFWIYREPYAKFIPLAAAVSAPLISLGIGSLRDRIKAANLRYVILTVLLGGFFWLGYPLLNGGIVWNINDGSVRSYRIRMPDYWQDYISDFRGLSGNVLLFPSYGVSDRYLWPSGYVGNPILLKTSMATINPVSGYNINEEALTVLNYFYNKLFSDPSRLIRTFRIYGINYLLFQGDLANKSEVNKRDLISESFIDLPKKTYGELDHYTFTDADLKFSLLNKSDLVTTDEDNISNYHFMRDIVPEEKLIIFSNEDKNDIYVLDQAESVPNDNGKFIKYKFSQLDPGEYAVYIDDSFGLFKGAKFGDVTLQSESEGRFKKMSIEVGEDCCSEIILDIDNAKPLQVQQEWTIFEKRGDDIYSGEAQGTVLDITSSNVGYYKKLEDYDPKLTYEVAVSGECLDEHGFSLYIVQLDLETGVEKAITGGTIASMRGGAVAIFKPGSFINSAQKANYYLVFKSVNDHVPSTGETSRLIINNVVVTPQFKSPLLISQKKHFEEQSESVKVLSEHNNESLADTLALPKYVRASRLGYYVSVQENSSEMVLKMTASYNKDWKLFVSAADSCQNQPGRFSLYLEYLQNFNKSKSPYNIEYIANGWDLPEGATCVGVVYIPELISQLAYFFAFVFIVLGLVLIK